MNNNNKLICFIPSKILKFVVFAGFVGLTSCEDVLIESPKSIAVETFYNNASEVESAVFSIYGTLKHLNGISGQLGAQVEAYTDYIINRGSYLVLSDFQGLNSTNITRTDEGWRLFYLGIRNANIVIQNASRGKNISQADVIKLVAEAKFLRAYNYLWLVRNWGGVPIRTENNMTEPNIKRASIEDVYNLILADLKEAETNLPDKPAQGGRVTKWSAKAALTEVYMTRNQYAEARSKADEIIKSNLFSLNPVKVVADFNKVFGPAYSTNPEDIWSLRMVNQTGQGQYLASFFGWGATKLQGAGNFGAFYTDPAKVSFIKNWDENDLRKSFNLLKFDVGAGSPSTVIFKKVADPIAPAQDGASNPFHIYRFADILLWFAEADCRVNGPTTTNLDALNQVRRRAYGLAPNTVATTDYKLADFTKETLINAVIQERGYETQCEAKRWLDLKRLGTTELKARIKAAFGKDIADKHLLWPIPNAEISFNTALDPKADQNPGY
jgi:hypothetical protein